MKINIKTLDQRTFQVDIDGNSTVWQLKTHLYTLPEINIFPEQQHLIYAGRLLENEHTLESCNFDPRKFLVVITRKEYPVSHPDDDKPPPHHGPSVSSTRVSKSLKNYKANKARETLKAKALEPRSEPSCSSRNKSTSKKDDDDDDPMDDSKPGPSSRRKSSTHQRKPRKPSSSSSESPPTNLVMVENFVEPVADDIIFKIVDMGYSEADVRRALRVSFQDVDRAMEYLIDGIPDFPELMGHGQPSNTETTEEVPGNVLGFLRDDPRFNQIRSIVQQRPDLLSMVLGKIGETNAPLLDMIRGNQEEFTSLLNETGSEPLNDEMSMEVAEIVLTRQERAAVDRLVGLGFSRSQVMSAYLACDKNEEQTADLLCRQMEDN